MKYDIRGRNGESKIMDFTSEDEAKKYADILNQERNEVLDDTPNFLLLKLRLEEEHD
ncbi:hypothetical protein HLG73_11885 [Lacticaseibacillus paracasei]|jgi:predicted DNA-binding WGR domain protein|uniref:hypothetical protein n=1 Tax=Lacticaseibacillus paracasei TaxID=1597 RepID=UPI00235907E9|nr:hypothetical protein [Lacticaseibacillus paracasei]WCZ19998.1 hypothetical protein HLG73_11885 [Lacticaseibacillus paracasei]